MLFSETLQTLNSILSGDLLINSRYDIVTNFNKLNTYGTESTAGVVQLTFDQDLTDGVGNGVITPHQLNTNILEFKPRMGLDLIIDEGGSAAYTTPTQTTSSWMTNIQYIHDSLVDFYDNTVQPDMDASYLRRDASDTPDADNSYDLGAGGARWSNIYAVRFQGTATTALYADIAEIYTCKDELEVGRLVSVCDEGEYEVEASTSELDIKCIGVVSEKPALLMNSGGEGTTVALVGKVPVAIAGAVKKGDVIVSSSIKGVGRAAKDPSEYVFGFARALESKPGIEFGLVNCIIKR